MSQQRIDMQYLLDRTAIHEVLARYYQGLDRGLPDQVRSCFTDDVKAYYDGQDPVAGIEALMNSLNTFKRLAAGELKATTHFMGNLNIHLLEGDVAETETYAIAYLVRPAKPADQVVMRCASVAANAAGASQLQSNVCRRSLIRQSPCTRRHLSR